MPLTGCIGYLVKMKIKTRIYRSIWKRKNVLLYVTIKLIWLPCKLGFKIEKLLHLTLTHKELLFSEDPSIIVGIPETLKFIKLNKKVHYTVCTLILNPPPPILSSVSQSLHLAFLPYLSLYFSLYLSLSACLPRFFMTLSLFSVYLHIFFTLPLSPLCLFICISFSFFCLWLFVFLSFRYLSPLCLFVLASFLSLSSLCLFSSLSCVCLP